MVRVGIGNDDSEFVASLFCCPSACFVFELSHSSLVVYIAFPISSLSQLHCLSFRKLLNSDLPDRTRVIGGQVTCLQPAGQLDKT